MKFLKDLKTGQVLKIAGLAVVAIVVVAVAFRLIGSSVNTVLNRGVSESYSIVAGSAGMPAYDMDYGGEMMKYEEQAIGLSSRNVISSGIVMPPTEPGAVVGDTSEDFEVTTYNATIETRQLDDTCKAITDLKARDYVIFENASEFDYGCNYYFKVKRANVAEILGVVMALDPRDFNENTETIKGLVDDYTSETEILQKKLASIDETLAKAVSAYDEVTALATRVQDVESLAKILDSKINIIERLTEERININAQLERIGRAKAEQLDRLEYTYFSVNIYETKFIDGEQLLDSWKEAIRSFVRDINSIAQDLSVNLVTVILRVLQLCLYLFIVLVVVKYGWKLVKYIWRR